MKQQASNRISVESVALRGHGGWTLIELVITLAVLTIMTLGVIPLVKTSVKRQREQQLRERLREVRDAIKEFHRDTIGGPCGGAMPGAAVGIAPAPASPQVVPPGQVQPPGPPGAMPGPMPPTAMIDPRSKVTISDCTIFKVDNPDRYPPTLETLIEGVNVVPRASAMMPGGGGGDPLRQSSLSSSLGGVSLKKKIYLRRIPVDPMTGEADWELRSNYDEPDAGSWGGENVFDVRSKSQDTALNGEKYSEW